MQAGPISHSLGRVPEAEYEAQRPGKEKQRQGRARRGEAGNSIVGLSCVCFLTAPPLSMGEVALVAWAREMSTGPMAEIGEGAC